MSEKLSRVLHVIASLSPVRGGTTAAVLEMIAGLESKGVSCEVATSDDDGPGRRLAADAPERRLPNIYYSAKRHNLYNYTPNMGPWLDTHVRDYDLVHIHGLFSHVNGLAGRICRRRSVPYVVTPHGMANRYSMRHKRLKKQLSFKLVERALLDGASFVHTTSRGEERDLADLSVRAPIVRIPLAVAPVPMGNGQAFRARHPQIGSRRLAVFMGRLDPIKNIEAAIDALALPGGQDYHLAICGYGPEDYACQLRARAKEHRIGERISWLGFVDGQAKADLLAAGDVYVQPSFSESFGMAAVEALSAGLPCVLGENVAIADDLVEAGFALALPPTGEGIARGLNSAAGLLQSGSSFAVRARSFVSNVFSKELIAQEMQQFYERALSGSVTDATQ